MRKNSVRKFIHAILDLLPLFVIPIFAININQKSVEPIQVEVQENKIVGFNQLIGADLSTYKSNYYVELKKNNATGSTQWWSLNTPLTYTLNHKYYVRIRQLENVVNGDYIQLGGTWQNVVQLGTYAEGNILTLTTINDGSIGLIFGSNTPQDNVIKFYFNLIDLTEMFGEGNEPTKTQFDEIFQENYYKQTDFTEVLIKDQLVTYNDTDIGSQFLYSLYIPVHDYFNFNNLFNMGAIYDWIQLNLFSGVAPLPVFIIWNIIVYEFFVDLIFLFYSVFMFIIDFTTNTIDSFVNKSRRL